MFEFMGQSTIAISVLELCDPCVCCLSPGPVASYTEEGAIGPVSEFDFRVIVWNLLNHCRLVDGEEDKRDYVPLFQSPFDGEGVRKPV